MATSIGLDIGSRAIKLVQLEKTRSGLRLVKTGMQWIPYREKESEPERLETVTKVISQLLSELKIHSRSFHLAISGQSVFIRTIQVIAVSRDKLHQHIRFEAEQQIPFALNEVLWDYCLMDSDKEKQTQAISGKWKVILAAIKKNLVDRQLEYTQKIGGSSGLIDVGPIALYNSVCVLDPDLSQKAIAIVDLGAKATNLVITTSEDIWIRSFPLGSDKLTQAIAEALHVDFNEAEVLKQRVGLQESSVDPAEKQVNDAVRSFLNDLMSEIQRSVEYYSNQLAAKGAPEKLKLHQVLLTGGGALLRGISPFFQEKLSTSVEVWSGFQKMPVRSGLPQAGQTQFTTAIGLALRGIKRCPIELNLIREQVTVLSKKKAFRWYGTGSLLLFLAILWTLVGFVRSEYHTKLTYLEDVKKTLQVYQTYEPKIREIESQNESLRDRVSALYRVVQQRQTWLDVLKTLGELLPKEVWIIGLEGGLELSPAAQDSTAGLIRLVGRSLSYQGVTDFVSGLKNSVSFSQVKPVASNIKKTETGEEVVEFEVEMKIVAR